jgi:hypothetical protein
MGRYAIIMVVGFSVIVGAMKLNMNRYGQLAQEQPADNQSAVSARAIAASAGQLCLYQLSQNTNWRTGYSNLALGDGSVNASVIDRTVDPSLPVGTVRVSATGTVNGRAATVQLLVQITGATWPSAVDAGITAQCNIQTNGNMLVDGRDHDWNGNVISNNGMKALSTTSTFSRKGNSMVAGTAAGADVAPTKCGYGSIVAENKVWPDGYPFTPDRVMGGASNGFSEGTLKSIAQSGVNGSQYATNPSTLTYPLRGVTYVELPSGSTWLPVDFGADSRGVLVVHNTATNAVMKNLNSGTFRGLIIADDMIHIHSQIIGAVFLLTTGPSAGNCIGNGNGSLLFCRDAVSQGVQGVGGSSASVAVIDYWE